MSEGFCPRQKSSLNGLTQLPSWGRSVALPVARPRCEWGLFGHNFKVLVWQLRERWGQGHTRVFENEMEKMSAGRTPFRPKVRFRGSEWARWLRLVALLFGNGIKCHGRRQHLDKRPTVAQVLSPTVRTLLQRAVGDNSTVYLEPVPTLKALEA